ncbi:unnamed protein product [Polarella glacialis]|uniref:Uncharacterized protein n=1 Tax=Polarella glacialis TaxID=89957 RepID=A0A813JVS4_POLGL|nr:unnamed protein product [Polarella glacialis]CAE8713759.1 unnamed protein product [Polarella glacialis]
MIPKLINGVPVEVEVLGGCALSGTSWEITGKLHNEGGTGTEQGSRRARPGLDSDQAACLHRMTRCRFGTCKLKQSNLEAHAAMLRSGGGTWITASKATFLLVNGKSCLEWRNGCTPMFALSSETNLNRIRTKISSPAVHQVCVGSDSTTAQLH